MADIPLIFLSPLLLYILLLPHPLPLSIFSFTGVLVAEFVWLVLGVVWLSKHYQTCTSQAAKDALLGECHTCTTPRGEREALWRRRDDVVGDSGCWRGWNGRVEFEGDVLFSDCLSTFVCLSFCFAFVLVFHLCSFNLLFFLLPLLSFVHTLLFNLNSLSHLLHLFLVPSSSFSFSYFFSFSPWLFLSSLLPFPSLIFSISLVSSSTGVRMKEHLVFHIYHHPFPPLFFSSSTNFFLFHLFSPVSSSLAPSPNSLRLHFFSL